MLYTVECTYTDSRTEEEWNNFYSQEKMSALISVNGFSTSQRFRSLMKNCSICPVYLAIHTIRDADVISSEEYLQKGGGSFSRWQSYIEDWHRNLYNCGEAAPAVLNDEILLLSQGKINNNAEGELKSWDMYSIGLDEYPLYRVAYVISRLKLHQFKDIKGVYLYEPITHQLKCTTNTF
ncbi:sugar ABC transporter [Vibrio spartinae]|uniref:Sugar ABC transporter n=1 Tax=Vibrio spartinae TaxID=1918945 RepID=A0ABX6R2D7_9VIBR|nr:sugar ABC transporter [Vibrio spartinae]QMV15691.1 hypothetical protein Vspart_03035 [Vibrio spartinae]